MLSDRKAHCENLRVLLKYRHQLTAEVLTGDLFLLMLSGGALAAAGGAALFDAPIWVDGVLFLVVSVLLPTGVHDTQCGFKMFRRAAAQKIFGLQRLDRWTAPVG